METVKYETLKEEFKHLRENIRVINKNFIVNLHTINKITVELNCSHISTECINDIDTYISQLIGAKTLIENFRYLNYKVDYSR